MPSLSLLAAGLGDWSLGKMVLDEAALDKLSLDENDNWSSDFESDLDRLGIWRCLKGFLSLVLALRTYWAQYVLLKVM